MKVLICNVLSDKDLHSLACLFFAPPAGTNAFFISMIDRPEWGNGFNVFGVLLEKDVEIVERILQLSTHEVVHDQYGTHMR